MAALEGCHAGIVGVADQNPVETMALEDPEDAPVRGRHVEHSGEGAPSLRRIGGAAVLRLRVSGATIGVFIK